jgi:ATP-dependent RNA helicase SUPV3L1/SUV3
MDEAESTTDTTEPQAPPEREIFDFSALRGFQVGHAIEGENRASELREDWIAALRLELDARAARLSESVDSALVLANDGVIRWLGDPIAKLTQGASLFAPTVIVLVDEALSEEGRLKVKTRVELWVAAYLRRLLGVLLDLGNLAEGSEVVREVAGLAAQSMGVLEREPIKSKIKALDQEARGELRKHGVRFGAYYIYLPALLKPAARALALHLAGLRVSGGDGSTLVETLAPLASSGRTSLKADPSISRDSYRIAGFRLCGERAVRVDIVERLADMIRAAVGQSGASGEGKTSPGFVVTPQMTSLTGCSGEQFASILRSLGYVGAPVRRSEFVRASKPAAAKADVEAAAPPTVEATSENRPLPALDGAQAAAGEPPALADDTLVEGDVGVSERESAASDPTPEEGAATVETSADSAQANLHETDQQAGKAPEEAAAAPEDDEMIVVWRRAPRFQPGPARSRSAARHPERRDAEAATSQTNAPQAQETDVGRPKFRRRRPPAKSNAIRSDAIPEPGGQPAPNPPSQPSQDAAPASARQESEPVSPRPDHRRSGNEAKLPARARQEQTKPVPNMDSPFAKLLELRPLLAKQNHKRS